MTKEGFWSVLVRGRAGEGVGVLTLDTGMVVGADAAGMIYDGRYQFDPKADELVCEISCKATKPGIWLVMTGQSVPEGFSFDVSVRLPRDVGRQQKVAVNTPFGPVEATFEKIRNFPD